MLLVITGEPGVGKSTLLLKVASNLRDIGVNVYALIAREIRVNGIRRGFEFIDLITNSTVNLALVKDNADVDYGISIGRYIVDINGCKRAAALLRDAIRADYMLVLFDEIGPMELASEDLSNTLIELLHSNKDVIAVVHKRIKHKVADMYKAKADKIIEVTKGNRDALLKYIIDYYLMEGSKRSNRL